MVPSFFKKLGPISSDVIKSSINCKIVNLSNDDYFDSFVSIDNISNNALSFLYDNEKLGDDFPLNSGIICTEKMANRLNPDQKKFFWAILPVQGQTRPLKLANEQRDPSSGGGVL